jgi:uncharacterized RDD family membrane protein YckC
MSVICPSCGEANGDAATMCGLCGAVLKRANEPQAPVPATAGAHPQAGAPVPRPMPPPPPPVQRPVMRQQARELVYVGLWSRVAATLIDIIVLILLLIPFIAALGAASATSAMDGGIFSGAGMALGGTFLLLMVSIFCVPAIYEIGMQVSSLNATLGMLAIGAKIADTDGNPPTFGAVFMRYFVKSLVPALAMLVLGMIGLSDFSRLVNLGWVITLMITIGTNEWKQGLHDQAAGTVVIRR